MLWGGGIALYLKYPYCKIFCLYQKGFIQVLETTAPQQFSVIGDSPYCSVLMHMTNYLPSAFTRMCKYCRLPVRQHPQPSSMPHHQWILIFSPSSSMFSSFWPFLLPESCWHNSNLCTWKFVHPNTNAGIVHWAAHAQLSVYKLGNTNTRQGEWFYSIGGMQFLLS